MAKPYKLSDKIQQTGLGKLKHLAFLNFTVRENITNTFNKLNLEDLEKDQIQIFVKLDDTQINLKVKINSQNKTLLTFLKTNVSFLEEELKDHYPQLNVELKLG